MAQYDLRNRVTIVDSINAASYTGATNGTSANMSGFDGALVVHNVGAVVGAPVVIMEDSDDDTTFATVATASLQTDMPAALGTTTDAQTYTALYKGRKVYLRTRIDNAGTSIILSSQIVQYPQRHLEP